MKTEISSDAMQRGAGMRSGRQEGAAQSARGASSPQRSARPRALKQALGVMTTVFDQSMHVRYAIQACQVRLVACACSSSFAAISSSFSSSAASLAGRPISVTKRTCCCAATAARHACLCCFQWADWHSREQ